MHKVGEYVVYRKEVCEIVDVKEKVFKDKDYYVLVPINDKSLKLQVPIDTDSNYLRDLISVSELGKIIKMIPQIEVINVTDKLIENKWQRWAIFFKTEKYLYTEFSIVLNKNYNETKEYIVSRVEEGKD